MFDPLHKWLGIPADEQPPNHYRLLGITLFEDDPDVIDAAADKHLAFLHDLVNGEHAAVAEELSNQVAVARLCLLNPAKQKAYDQLLRQQLGSTRGTYPSGVVEQRAPIAVTPAPIPVVPADAMTATEFATTPPPGEPTIARSPADVAPIHKRSHGGRRHGRKSYGLRYRHYATLFCLLVLIGVGVGLKQGKLNLDPALLKSVGIEVRKENGSRSVDAGESASTNDLALSASGTGATSNPNGSPVNPRTDMARENSQPRLTDRMSSPAQSPNHFVDVPPSSPNERPQRSDSPRSMNSMEAPKYPQPSAAELEQKLALVRDLYEARYRTAKTPSEKIALARQMYRDGEETHDDSVGRFALWRVAWDILKLEGDFEAAMDIVDVLQRRYDDINACAMKANTLQSGAKRISRKQVSDFADAVISVVDECCREQQYDLAKSLCDFTREEIGSRMTASKRTELEAMEFRIDRRERRYHQYQESWKTLANRDEDPDANHNVGAYLCFVGQSWDEGNKYLARGPEGPIQSAAQSELAVQEQTGTMASDIADAWYEIARSSENHAIDSDEERDVILVHAWRWYERALDQSSGLVRKKVEQRIKQIASEVKIRDVVTDPADLKDAMVIAYRLRNSDESRTDFAQRKGNTFSLGMGNRLDGRGEADAGIELQGVEKVTVVGSASQPLANINAFSKSGFMIDYHTPGGYSKRVFLGLGMQPGREFSQSPPWGKASKPQLVTDIGRSDTYQIDLTRWAPPTWDGRCWFSLVMQNAGANRTIEATVSW